MGNKSVIYVPFGTTFIDKYVPGILEDEQKAIVQDSNTVTIVTPGSMPANAVLNSRDPIIVTKKDL